MECREIQEKFSAYLGDFLPSRERELVEEHLKSCGKCRESLADLRKTIGHVHDLEAIEPPAWLAGKVMARIQTEAEQKKGIIERLFYPLAVKLPIQAVATVLIVATAVYLFRVMEPEVKITQIITEEAPQKLLPEEKDKTIDTEKGRSVPEQKAPEILSRKASEMKESEAVGTSVAPEPQEEAAPFPRQASPSAPKQDASVTLEESIKKKRDQPKDFFPSLGAKGSVEKKAEAWTAEVLVIDIAAATKEIEAVILNLNGRITGNEYKENRHILVAEIDSRHLNELIQKLEGMGRVQKKTADLGLSAPVLTLRIIIVTP
jgi:hypothetical protein